jgi:hypothetical protein
MKNSSKKKPSKTPNKLKKPKKTSKIDQNRPKFIQKSSKTTIFQKINFFQLFRPPKPKNRSNQRLPRRNSSKIDPIVTKIKESLTKVLSRTQKSTRSSANYVNL